MRVETSTCFGYRWMSEELFKISEVTSWRLGVPRKVIFSVSFLAKTNERCVAIDCFENQAEINRDEEWVITRSFRHAEFCEAMKEDSKFVWNGCDSDTRCKL